MRRVFMLSLWLALAAQGGCRRAPAPESAPLASSSGSSSAAASGSAAASEDFPADEQELGAASAVALGPSPPGALSGERAERLRGLLRGQLPGASLPLVETDPGAEYARNLYDSLTTEVTPLVGLGGLGAEKLNVTLSPPSVLSGKLDVGELTQRANVMSGAFRRCYQRARLDEPKLEGKVSLLFVVEPEGAVSSVAVESAPPRSSGLQACMKARAQSQLFPGLVAGSQARFRLQVGLKAEAP